MKNVELGEFPFVKMFVWENKFTVGRRIEGDTNR